MTKQQFSARVSYKGLDRRHATLGYFQEKAGSDPILVVRHYQTGRDATGSEIRSEFPVTDPAATTTRYREHLTRIFVRLGRTIRKVIRMKKTYTLTNEAMEAFLCTDVFRALPEDQAGSAEDFLPDSFGGSNQVDINELRLRLDRVIDVVRPADEAGVRAEILKALGVRRQ